MKRVLTLVCLTLVIGCCLGGCKSDDYEQAVALQASGDYSGALAIFETLDGYKDSVARITVCNTMIAAIDEYNNAVVFADSQNAELDAAITDAEALVAENNPALDNSLLPDLETAISECKVARTTIPAMPADADEIVAVASELNAIDYSTVIANLAEKISALEISIRQYSLVNAPSEAYIIECLMKVPNVVDISAATEDNDPNGNLNKAGGYTAQVYFSCDLIDQSAIYGSTVIEKGTACGGSIEVYSSAEDAVKRNEYLAVFDGTWFSNGSHAIVGTVIIRISDELTASQQKELEANIIEILTSLE